MSDRTSLPAGPGRGICSGDTVLLADVGNSRIKLARLDDFAAGAGLPAVSRRQDLDSRGFHPDNLERWLLAVAPGPAVILVASVYEAAATRLEATVAEISVTQHRPVRQRRIGHADLPLVVALDEPHRVGIDRLAAATAAGLVKPGGRPAVVVDCGTAVTVDMVAADGRFLGGAILPGPGLMARSLAEGTSKLPAVAGLVGGEVPAMPGRSTEAAIAAGIGHGIRGAVSRLVAEAQAASGGHATTILTGGWADAVRDVLPGAVVISDLVLAGIALGAGRACAR
ncbi:MAG: type III pantothenate kinase [Planctomycetota bacterium]